MTIGELTAWWRSDRGSIAAEISLITPFLVMLMVFVAVFIHRGVDARIRIDDAAHQAARAASIERSPATATAAAESTASAALSEAGLVCRSLSVHTATDGPRPAGSVAVTVSCDVDFGSAVLLSVPDDRRLSATAIEPVDIWRSTLGLGSRS